MICSRCKQPIGEVEIFNSDAMGRGWCDACYRKYHRNYMRRRRANPAKRTKENIRQRERYHARKMR